MNETWTLSLSANSSGVRICAWSNWKIGDPQAMFSQATVGIHRELGSAVDWDGGL
jgi:hypothetical protein